MKRSHKISDVCNQVSGGVCGFLGLRYSVCLPTVWRCWAERLRAGVLRALGGTADDTQPACCPRVPVNEERSLPRCPEARAAVPQAEPTPPAPALGKPSGSAPARQQAGIAFPDGSWTKDRLRGWGKERGIKLGKSWTKRRMLEAIGVASTGRGPGGGNPTVP